MTSPKNKSPFAHLIVSPNHRITESPNHRITESPNHRITLDLNPKFCRLHLVKGDVANKMVTHTHIQNLKSVVETRQTGVLNANLGPLIGAAFEDLSVVEIMLNQDGRLWLERAGESIMQCAGEIPAAQSMTACKFIAGMMKTELHENAPELGGEMPGNNYRFQLAIPPVVERCVFSIRKPATQIFSLASYVERGMMTATQWEKIREAIHPKQGEPLNILVIGGTGTGKTTLVNAVIREIADICPGDRLVILEDTKEIQSSNPNTLIMRTVRKKDRPSEYIVSLQNLLHSTLRHRPDRIIVGEVRGGECLQVVKAWNTGHPGGVATLHANTAADALYRVEAMIAETGAAVGPSIQRMIAAAVNLIIEIRRSDEPRANGGILRTRRIHQMLSVTGHDGRNYTTLPF